MLSFRMYLHLMDGGGTPPLNVSRHITAVIEITQHFYSTVIALMVIAGHET